MTSRPITGELRDAMLQLGWVEKDGSITFVTSPMPPSIDAEQSLAISGSDFDRHCDAIDSIHANLERENASLKAELDRLMGEQECERPTPTDGITDELRTWAKGPTLSSWMAEHLTVIADHIDAEHEEAIQQALMGEGGVPATDENMAEHGWIRMPVDADGVPIHIGDVMEWPDNGETFEVVGIGDGWTLFYVIEDGVAEWTRAENKRHHQPDTWERIIEDARTCTGSAGNYTSVPSMRWTNEVDALVARCRALAGDAS